MSNKKAVALKYAEAKSVPAVVAVARGHLYEKMIELAKLNSIEIYEDKDLTEVLSAMSVGSEIPEELYRAVAEILAYCYKVNSKLRHKMNGIDK